MNKTWAQLVILYLGCTWALINSVACRSTEKKYDNEPERPPILEVPFQFEHNQIIIEVMINGKGPFNLFLDTGGNPSLVDLSAAKEAAIPLDTSEAGEAEGVGDQQITIYAAEITELEIAGTVLGNVDAVAMNLGHISQRLGKPLHGVLGYSFLKDRIVQIDYPAKTLRIFSESDHKTFNEKRKPVHSAVFPLKFLSGQTIPYIEEFYINGKKIKVTLDTGSSLNLELFPWSVKVLGLHQEKEQEDSASVVGARGQAAVKKGLVDSVQIGNFKLYNQEVVFADRQHQDSLSRGGNLGNGLLKHFVLTLDYKNNKLVFEQMQ